NFPDRLVEGVPNVDVARTIHRQARGPIETSIRAYAVVDPALTCEARDGGYWKGPPRPASSPTRRQRHGGDERNRACPPEQAASSWTSEHDVPSVRFA